MLNENLSRVRKERSLTQEALAIKLNVVRQTVSKWEKGTAVPDADTLCRIADALDVPVVALLGDSAYEEQQDTESIAKALAQINEQLAIRNRHTATVWKILCLFSLIVIGLLIGRVHWEANHENSEIRLPDIADVSDVRFSSDDEELTCFFVPSIGNEDITYMVTLTTTDKSMSGVATAAQYENGICNASFDKSTLSGSAGYYAVLTIDYHGEVRNVKLADGLCFDEDSCSWQP
ncbi:MAG: helix-turn-helix domain-containing protein [Clostridia bacterium]|nr:helix-turn-helix domain-containing protein [Clostridia bacterium]